MQSVLFTLVAHGGESHANTTEAQLHAAPWYVQIFLLVAVSGIFLSVVWLITQKLDTALLATSTILLFGGLGLYAIMPIVSIIAISVGLGATLILTLTGLGLGSKKSPPSEKP